MSMVLTPTSTFQWSAPSIQTEDRPAANGRLVPVLRVFSQRHILPYILLDMWSYPKEVLHHANRSSEGVLTPGLVNPQPIPHQKHRVSLRVLSSFYSINIPAPKSAKPWTVSKPTFAPKRDFFPLRKTRFRFVQKGVRVSFSGDLFWLSCLSGALLALLLFSSLGVFLWVISGILFGRMSRMFSFRRFVSTTKRPTSPHLSIYQPQLTWYLSSAFRITGVMYVGRKLWGRVFRAGL